MPRKALPEGTKRISMRLTLSPVAKALANDPALFPRGLSTEVEAMILAKAEKQKAAEAG